MIKKLDIPSKIKFQDFVKKMAVVHFADTKFLDLLNDVEKGKRTMHRYTHIPNTHVENFDVKISVEAIGNQDDLPVDVRHFPVTEGILYHIYVEISEGKRVIDYFEIMEYVEAISNGDTESLYALYTNSDTKEESDFED